MRVPERTNALTLLGVAIELGSTALMRYCSTIVEANVVASPSRVKIGSRCSLSNDTASRTAETPRYAVRPVDEGREKRLLSACKLLCRRRGQQRHWVSGIADS